MKKTQNLYETAGSIERFIWDVLYQTKYYKTILGSLKAFKNTKKLWRTFRSDYNIGCWQMSKPHFLHEAYQAFDFDDSSIDEVINVYKSNKKEILALSSKEEQMTYLLNKAEYFGSYCQRVDKYKKYKEDEKLLKYKIEKNENGTYTLYRRGLSEVVSV
jgi:hypothetical protein